MWKGEDKEEGCTGKGKSWFMIYKGRHIASEKEYQWLIRILRFCFNLASLYYFGLAIHQCY